MSAGAELAAGGREATVLLDRPSADVLAFVSRRVPAEPITIMMSVRDGTGDPFEPAGLPALAVGALDRGTAQALLAQIAPDLDGEARRRLLDDAEGNPLALVELPAAVRSAGLVPGRLPVGDLLRRSVTARVAELPDPARLLLSVAAARTDIGQVEPFGHARQLIITGAVHTGLAGAGPPVAELVAAARDTQAAGDVDLAAKVLWAAASRCWWTSAGRQDRLAVVDAVQALNLQLTPQELQIAQLAARGLSNRQVGEQLFLSHRTVGSHLYHLFPKLGITTRAQLADALKAPGPAGQEPRSARQERGRAGRGP